MVKLGLVFIRDRWRVPVIKGNIVLLTLLGISLAFFANAEVYRVIDEEGDVTYTDNPPANNPTTEAISLPSINTQPAIEVLHNEKQAEETAANSYQEILIVTPAHDATIPPGQQLVPVEISLKPTLKMGHLVQLIFDGQPYGPATSTTSFSIRALIRGEHRIQARIVDGEGAIIGASNTSTIHVKRHSIKHNKN